jgi:subtilisin family serine protease
MFSKLFIILGCLTIGVLSKVDYNPNRILVQFKDQPSSSAAVDLNKYGLNVYNKNSHLESVNIVAYSINDHQTATDKINLLKSMSNIEKVEYDYKVKINYADGPGSFNLYGIDKIKAPCAWDWATTGSNNVKVCIIDTGIDYNHVDLKNNIWNNPLEFGKVPNVDDDRNGYKDDIHGINAITNTGNPFDDNNHGTHVAGTIGAIRNNAGAVGVSQKVKIIACKFLDASGSGYISDAIKCINYCKGIYERERKASVANQLTGIYSNSWAGGGFSSILYNAIKATDVGYTRGLFIAAAGNSGVDNDVSFTYPASYDLPNIISVAATDSTDTLAYFSSYGLKTVDLAAPGVSIYSSIPGNRYAQYSGTSMATPHVAGASALIAALRVNATSAQIKGAILKVDPIVALKTKMVSGGRLNAMKATGNILGRGCALC